jgi:hypothetical protein
MRLQSPMFSRSGPIPAGDHAYELKFDALTLASPQPLAYGNGRQLWS